VAGFGAFSVGRTLMRARLRGTELYFDCREWGGHRRRGRMREKTVAFVDSCGRGRDQRVQAGFTPLSAKMPLVTRPSRTGTLCRGDPERYTLDANVEGYGGAGGEPGRGRSSASAPAMRDARWRAHAERYRPRSKLVVIVTAAHGAIIDRAQAIVRRCGRRSSSACVTCGGRVK